MLVLSRKKGDWVVIAGNVRVQVMEIRGDSIRLGIEAPRDVPVHRHEVFERLAAEERMARESLAPPTGRQSIMPPTGRQSGLSKPAGSNPAVSKSTGPVQPLLSPAPSNPVCAAV